MFKDFYQIEVGYLDAFDILQLIDRQIARIEELMQGRDERTVALYDYKKCKWERLRYDLQEQMNK